MPGLTLREEERRRRVVHGWSYDASLSEEERLGISRYLTGLVDKPPERWVRIDEVLK